MNTTNRFIAPPKRRRSRFYKGGPVFWAGTVIFTGVLLGVLYCLLTHRVPI